MKRNQKGTEEKCGPTRFNGEPKILFISGSLRTIPIVCALEKQPSRTYMKPNQKSTGYLTALVAAQLSAQERVK